MKTLQSILSRTSTVKSIGIFFVVSHLIFLAMMLFIFPKINAQIGTKAFDLQTFGYSFSEATAIVNNLNEEITDLYIFPQLTLLDVLYPVLLTFFISSLLFRLMTLTKTKSKMALYLLLVPFVAMFFDYVENICVILMISKSVPLSETIVQLASTCTILKGALTTFSWISVLGFAFIWLKMNILGKGN